MRFPCARLMSARTVSQPENPVRFRPMAIARVSYRRRAPDRRSAGRRTRAAPAARGAGIVGALPFTTRDLLLVHISGPLHERRRQVVAVPVMVHVGDPPERAGLHQRVGVLGGLAQRDGAVVKGDGLRLLVGHPVEVGERLHRRHERQVVLAPRQRLLDRQRLLVIALRRRELAAHVEQRAELGELVRVHLTLLAVELPGDLQHPLHHGMGVFVTTLGPVDAVDCTERLKRLARLGAVLGVGGAQHLFVDRQRLGIAARALQHRPQGILAGARRARVGAGRVAL